MPAMKAILARLVGDPGWLAVREPLLPLTDWARGTLIKGLTSSGLPAPELAGALS